MIDQPVRIVASERIVLPELGVWDVSIDAGATGLAFYDRPRAFNSQAHHIAKGTGHRISKEAPVP
jgi:hypothetical protein